MNAAMDGRGLVESGTEDEAYAQYRGQMYRMASDVFLNERSDEALKAELEAVAASPVDDFVRASEHRLMKQLRQLAERSDQHAGVTARSQYAALFVGPRAPLAHPYESVYVGRKSRLFTEVTLQVRECYQRSGLEMPKAKAGRVPDDHLAYELAFLAALCDREAQAWAQQDGPRAFGLREAQRVFLDDHLTAWAPAFAERCEAAFPESYYGAWACFVRDFAAEDAAYLKDVAAAVVA